MPCSDMQSFYVLFHYRTVKELIINIWRYAISVFQIFPSNSDLVSVEERAIFWPQSVGSKDPGLVGGVCSLWVGGACPGLWAADGVF